MNLVFSLINLEFIDLVGVSDYTFRIGSALLIQIRIDHSANHVFNFHPYLLTKTMYDEKLSSIYRKRKRDHLSDKEKRNHQK